MRIAMICTEKLPVPPIRGGAIQQYIDAVLPYLKEKHDVTVFCVADPELPQKGSNNICYIKAVKTHDYISGVIDHLNDGYDLIHVFNRPQWVNLIAEKLPYSKISLSLHNEMFQPSKITKEEGEKCIRRVKFITTVSRFVESGVKKLYPEAAGKIHTVYSGVDVNRYQPVWSQEATIIRDQLKARYGLAGKKVVLFIGRLGQKKGAHILIKAVNLVLSSHPDTALVLVGSKWYGENQEDSYVRQVKQMADALDTDVVLTGFLPPNEVVSHYYLGDVFICASQWREPLARVHYEAMAAGIPIITTDRGGSAEVVKGKGNGIVISEYNQPQAFADAITYLLEQPDIALEMGTVGRRLAEEKYSWKRVAMELNDLFL
ncbi:MAG: glycosyltransferase family 4 protein [Eubacteriales bacterium]|nr:glycosyltransferase family 4 protein [Eubacteriales bacterium]